MRRNTPVLVVLLILLVLSLVVMSELAKQPARYGTISIDYNKPLRLLAPKAFGMDISGYFYPDVFANDVVEQQKIKALGIKYMRMHLLYSTSGDAGSKIICGGDGCDKRWSGDDWITAIKNIGAEPVVTISADSARDAANMVQHFNRDTNNTVHSWIIGNEPNANGVSPQSYGNTFNQDYDAMKAVDPTIQIGGGATAWYDDNWLRQFLQVSGQRIDFVDFHGYAQEGKVAGDYTQLFHLADGYGKSVTELRKIIQETIPARASKIGIEVGEWELDWGGSAQNDTNFHAVWTATVLGGILKAGGWSLFYADKGNLLYGSPHVFTEAHGRKVSIAQDDTNPAYHGIGMFTGEGRFRSFGTTMVDATTNLPNIEVFASDHEKNIVVINKDPSAAQTATIQLKGITSATIEIWRKDDSVSFLNPPIKLETLTAENGTFTYSLSPFSVTTFIVQTNPS